LASRDIVLWRGVKHAYIDILNRLGVTHTWQTDERTDGHSL